MRTFFEITALPSMKSVLLIAYIHSPAAQITLSTPELSGSNVSHFPCATPEIIASANAVRTSSDIKFCAPQGFLNI